MDKYLTNNKISSIEKERDWPSEYSYLKELEDYLYCPICKEIYNGPTTLLCGHTFCSLCIRVSFSNQQVKKFCPQCTTPSNENDLRRAAQLDAIALRLKSLKSKLINGAKKDNIDFQIVEPSKRIESKQNGRIIDESNDKLITENEADKNNKSGQKVEGGFHSCPICNLIYDTKEDLEIHMSNCFFDDSDGIPLDNEVPIEEPIIDRSKYLPKVAYNLMTDKQLKDLLKKYELSAKGDRSTLQKRHTHFTNLYNSNLDVLNPKPLSTLLKELESWEKIQKNENRSAILNEVDCIKHQNKYKDQFRTLIQNARKKRKHKCHVIDV